MPITALDPKTALIVIDLQKGILALAPANAIGDVVKHAGALTTTFRKRGLPVAVGRTRLADCPAGEPLCSVGGKGAAPPVGAVYSSGGVCFSACPFMLAGGARRVYSTDSFVGVHQITTTYDEVRVRYRTEYQTVNGKRRVVASREIGRKLVGQRSTTKLTKAMRTHMLAYFKQMGVDASILDMAQSATPQSIHLIPQVDALRIGLATEAASADDLVMAGACAASDSIAHCLPPPAAEPQQAEPQPNVPPLPPPLLDTTSGTPVV